jgi:hypothetical protein
MRTSMLIVLLAAMPLTGVALAQGGAASPSRAEVDPQREAPEEVIVRGRRLSELRYEVQAAREHAYDVFNALNSDDEFDILCRDERKYHSRTKRRVCKARFETDISADAANEYMSALFFACRPDSTGEFNLTACMFSDASENARSRAQAVEGEAGPKRDALSDEIWHVANEHPEFAQAILDYFEFSQQYDAATTRGRRDD